MAALQAWGLVGKAKGDKKNGFCYEVKDYGDYESRLNSISTVLDDTLEQLQAGKKEAVVQEAHKKSNNRKRTT